MTYELILNALADPTRRKVFESIAIGPKSVGEIADSLPVSGPAVSQHLGVLKLAGLVSERREGTRRIYQIEPEGLIELRQWLDDIWDDGLNKLKKLSEKPYEH
jgi:DNA-binding transcriptional ArsR family regulator